MVRIMCDRCGLDCNLVGYDVRVNVIHNPTPHSIFEFGEPKLTDDNTHVRFVLCQKCYWKFALPNIYMAKEAKRIVWRDDDFLAEADMEEPDDAG